MPMAFYQRRQVALRTSFGEVWRCVRNVSTESFFVHENYGFSSLKLSGELTEELLKILVQITAVNFHRIFTGEQLVEVFA